MFGSRNVPEIRHESSTSLLALIGAMGVGAALMYVLHPANRVRDEAIDDGVLAERVRAAMGHVISDPHAIEIRVHDGQVTLKGPALQGQIGEIVACAERVRGVRGVDNRLSVSNPS